MIELFEAAFSMVNIIPTVLLMFALAYWLMVILGAIDLDAFDFDVELETDMELDAEAAVDATGEVDISWFNNVLSFFNIDKIPLMVFITFWVIPVWVISIIVNDIVGNSSFLFSLLLLLPNLFMSLFVAKPITIPFVRLFKYLDEDTESAATLLGATGKVILSASDTKMGQGEIIIDGANYRLNIKTKKGIINKGEQLLVINYIKKTKTYIVEPYETID